MERLDRRAFLHAAASVAAAACADAPTGPRRAAIQADVRGVEVVQLTGPTAVPAVGSLPLITGAVLDLAGTRERLGIEDGLQNVVTSLTTDVNGRFVYRGRVLAADACGLTVITRAQRFPFLLQAARRAGSALEADSLHVRGIVVDNRASRDVKATWTGPQGQTTTITVKRGAKAPVLLHDAVAIPRVTAWGGVRLPMTVLAAPHAVDAAGLLTVLTVGTAITVAGRVYADGAAALRGCWSPRFESGRQVVRLLGRVEAGVGRTAFRLATVRTPPPGALASITLRIL